MARTDKMIIEAIEATLTEGQWNSDGKGEWDDGSTAKAKSLFGVQLRYDPNIDSGLSNLKKTPMKWSIGEVLWIHQDQSNDVNLLEEKYGPKWWKKWADARGTLGKAYGYQAAKKHIYLIDDEEVRMTQIDYVRWALKNDPDNRRLRITLWNPRDQYEMTLPPCAHTMEFRVWNNRLYMKLQQRSQDVVAALSVNAFQYMSLMRMLAAEAGLELGEFVHEITDFHIYDRHIEAAQEMVRRFYEQDVESIADATILPLEQKDFYDYRVEDIVVHNYNPLDTIAIEIANV